MFERILVALDGSQLSEATLPYVAALSSALGRKWSWFARFRPPQSQSR